MRGAVTKRRETHEVRVALEKDFGVQSARPEYLVEMVARSALMWAWNACRPAGVSRTQVRGFRLMRPFSMLTIFSPSSVARFFDSLTGERRVCFNPCRG